MANLKELSFKPVYRTGVDDLYRDFYAPAMASSVRYDRAVGYFSSEILSMSLKGLSKLVSANGEMRLIIGHPLTIDEFNAVKHGIMLKEMVLDLAEKLEDLLTQPQPNTERLELLSWLIACNRLEIKFALRHQGMYHEKIGIFTDEYKNRLVFHGSANETPYGMMSAFNAESISVFKSWEQDAFDKYGAEYEQAFERLWNNKEEHTITVDIPSNTYKRISESARYKSDKIKTIVDADDFNTVRELEVFRNEPNIPKMINSQIFIIREHQKTALSKWKSASFKGILQLATGSGKTITAIYGAIKVYEARKKQNQPLMILIAVPYIELASQWISNLEIFNIHAIECFQKKSNWFEALTNKIKYFNAGVVPFVCAVVVNKTLVSDDFQKLIKQVSINALMFIGDECHNHSSLSINSSLPDAAYRIGLSATPFRSDDDEVDSPFPNDAKQRLLDYYGEVVATYSLGDAIHDGVLTPYEYHIITVKLTDDEQMEYDELSFKIQNLLAKSKNFGLSKDDQESLSRLCGQRSRLLGGARNKLVKLKEITSSISEIDRSHTLFYSGEGKPFSSEEINDTKIIDQISNILKDNGWRASQFTSANNRRQRIAIMEAFKDRTIDALVAMKVLDEGIDVPVCKTAYILSSTRNPRQYIQRRGRILRKSKEKTVAKIYDFVILPAYDSIPGDALKRAEAVRINDFAVLAINKMEIEQIILNYGLIYNEY